MQRPVPFYPTSNEARDTFVLSRRPSRVDPDPWQLQDLLVEDELAADGRIARTATVFLTGRECPWRCVMCDLWRHTTTSDTPPHAITAQIAAAHERLSREPLPVSHIKLYNAGSFFDPRAVPDSDYDAIAAALTTYTRVIVESHPSLIGGRGTQQGTQVDRFLDALAAHGRPQPLDARLEVAMGLETAHPHALEQLHKRMTVDQFVTAAGRLTARGVAVRAFLLIGPPFIPRDEQTTWLLRSIAVAIDSGASTVSLIPTRGGNGAMEALTAVRCFAPPTLDDIEAAVDAAHEWRAAHRTGARLLVDLWDLERFATCPTCAADRRARLHRMNLTQQMLPASRCPHTGIGPS